MPKVELKLKRFAHGKDDTLGALFINGNFAAFTLEDEARIKKLSGETRIPAGTFRLQLRTEGSLTKKYEERFPDIHKGMLWLLDVPGFEWIYIHCGNTEDHTDGCILVGDTSQQNIESKGFIGNSSAAYKRIYPKIAKAILENRRVYITIEDKL